MENTDNITKYTEQTKKAAQEFHQQLKNILSKDEYNIFKTKTKNNLGKIHADTEVKIQSLLDIKTKCKNVIERLEGEKLKLVSENEELYHVVKAEVL